MRYAQIKVGRKLHLVYDYGDRGLSAPLCHTNWFKNTYRMTINVPLANACKNCLRVYRAAPKESV